MIAVSLMLSPISVRTEISDKRGVVSRLPTRRRRQPSTLGAENWVCHRVSQGHPFDFVQHNRTPRDGFFGALLCGLQVSLSGLVNPILSASRSVRLNSRANAVQEPAAALRQRTIATEPEPL